MRAHPLHTPKHALKCPHCGSISLNVQVRAWAIWYRGALEVVDVTEYVELLADPVVCRDCGKESKFSDAEKEARKNPEGLSNG